MHFFLHIGVGWVCLFLAACQAVTPFNAAGILVEETADVPNVGVTLVAEQTSGYQQAGTAADFDLVLKYATEGSQEDDVQVAMRTLAEKEKVLVVLGATSNEASMRAAALANFFNVPLVIPNSTADNLLPSNNLWSFRLSAPGEAHAAFLFGQIMNKQALRQSQGDDSMLALKIAILYEQNTFGESAAVATAKAAMQQELEIGLYANFDPQNPDAASLQELVTGVWQQQADLVYLISSQASVARQLVQAMHNQYSAEFMPVVVGQAGGFSSLEFLQSPEAAGVYVLQQRLDPKNCPVDLHSITEAQAYAALYLVNYAVTVTQAPVVEKPTLKLPGGLTEKDRLTSQREAVRDVLKAANLDLPCLGPVAFDNMGQNKNVQFELITFRDGEFQPVSQETFLEVLR